MDALSLIDQMLESTLALRQAIQWRKNALRERPKELPFAIAGLDDPIYLDYQQHEHWRQNELAASLDEIKRRALDVRQLERDLQTVLPRNVWIRHDWQDRVFAVGLTADGTFQCHLLKFEWQISELPALPKSSKNTRIMPEWERAIYDHFHHQWLKNEYLLTIDTVAV